MEPYIYRRPNGDVLDIRGTGEVAVVTVQPVEGDDSATIVIPADDLGKVFGALREACGLPSPVILGRSSARFPVDGSRFRFGDFGFRLYPEGVAPSLPGIEAMPVPPGALRELAAHLVSLADHAEAVPLATIRRAVTAMRADAERCGDKPGSFVSEVADWLDIEAAGLERKLPDDSGSVHVALRVARAYLGEGSDA